MSVSPDTQPSDPQPIPAYKKPYPPRRSRKPQALKTAVIARLSQGATKTSIANEFQISRNCVTGIAEESGIEQTLKSLAARSVEIVGPALDCVAAHVEKGSLTASQFILENTIFPLQSKTSKHPDIGLTVAIQNLMQVNDASTLHNNAAEPSTSQPAENTQVIEAEQVKS